MEEHDMGKQNFVEKWKKLNKNKEDYVSFYLPSQKPEWNLNG